MSFLSSISSIQSSLLQNLQFAGTSSDKENAQTIASVLRKNAGNNHAIQLLGTVSSNKDSAARSLTEGLLGLKNSETDQQMMKVFENVESDGASTNKTDTDTGIKPLLDVLI